MIFFGWGFTATSHNGDVCFGMDGTGPACNGTWFFFPFTMTTYNGT